MAFLQRSKSGISQAARKDSGKDVMAKRSRASTIATIVIPNSKKRRSSAASVADGINNGSESLGTTNNSVFSSVLALVKTNATGEDAISVGKGRRRSILGVRKVLSRTGAFVKEVCKADVRDARGVNAYLEKSRSREQLPRKSTNVQIGQYEWTHAQGQWHGFSCSNTPLSTPVTEKANPFSYIEAGSLNRNNEKDKATSEQNKKKNWWMTWKSKSRDVQPSASAFAKRASETRNEGIPDYADPVEAGPSNWHSACQHPTSPFPPHGLPPTREKIVLCALLDAARHYHQACLLETYLPYLPKKFGKRHNARTADYYIRSRSCTWNNIFRELRLERTKRARWEKQEELLKRDSPARFWERGKDPRTMVMVSDRPTTPYLDELDQIVQALHDTGVCRNVRTKHVYTWIEGFVRARNPAFPPMSKRESTTATTISKRSVKAELINSGAEEGDGDDLCAEKSSIEELVESLAFDALAEKLAEDLLLVQWVRDGRHPHVDHGEEEDKLLQGEIRGAIEKVRNEWFRLVFVQDACTLDGQEMGLPARVYKILSKKGQRKVKERAREVAQRRQDHNDGSSRSGGEWYIWDIAEEDGDGNKENAEEDEDQYTHM